MIGAVVDAAARQRVFAAWLRGTRIPQWGTEVVLSLVRSDDASPFDGWRGQKAS
jgi:hypothetical protein